MEAQRLQALQGECPQGMGGLGFYMLTQRTIEKSPYGLSRLVMLVSAQLASITCKSHGYESNCILYVQAQCMQCCLYSCAVPQTVAHTGTGADADKGTDSDSQLKTCSNVNSAVRHFRLLAQLCNGYGESGQTSAPCEHLSGCRVAHTAVWWQHQTAMPYMWSAVTGS